MSVITNSSTLGCADVLLTTNEVSCVNVVVELPYTLTTPPVTCILDKLIVLVDDPLINTLPPLTDSDDCVRANLTLSSSWRLPPLIETCDCEPMVTRDEFENQKLPPCTDNKLALPMLRVLVSVPNTPPPEIRICDALTVPVMLLRSCNDPLEINKLENDNESNDCPSTIMLPPDTVELEFMSESWPDECNEPPLTVIDDWSTSDSIVLDPRSTLPPLTEIDAVVACTRA